MTTPYEQKYGIPTIKRYGPGFIIEPKQGEIMRSENWALVEKKIGPYVEYLDYIELKIQRDKLLVYVKEIRQGMIDNLEAGAFDPSEIKDEIDKTSNLIAEVEGKNE